MPDLPTALRRKRTDDDLDVLFSIAADASFGPATPGPLADVLGLTDEYLLVLHPAPTAGPPLLSTWPATSVSRSRTAAPSMVAAL